MIFSMNRNDWFHIFLSFIVSESMVILHSLNLLPHLSVGVPYIRTGPDLEPSQTETSGEFLLPTITVEAKLPKY